jgi:hypothetical protein
MHDTGLASKKPHVSSFVDKEVLAGNLLHRASWNGPARETFEGRGNSLCFSDVGAIHTTILETVPKCISTHFHRRMAAATAVLQHATGHVRARSAHADRN